jgi:hypothetical protein
LLRYQNFLTGRRSGGGDASHAVRLAPMKHHIFEHASFAEVTARLDAVCRRPISQSDAQIPWIAAVRSAAIAIRDMDNFEGCGMAPVGTWAE